MKNALIVVLDWVGYYLREAGNWLGLLAYRLEGSPYIDEDCDDTPTVDGRVICFHDEDSETHFRDQLK